jgi:hypothetical protein
VAVADHERVDPHHNARSIFAAPAAMTAYHPPIESVGKMRAER